MAPKGRPVGCSAAKCPNVLLLIATLRDLPFKTDTKLSAPKGSLHLKYPGGLNFVPQ
jgi:hypothetical protein